MMITCMLVLRILTGSPALPELFEDQVIALLPGSLFGSVLDRLQFAAKPLLFIGLASGAFNQAKNFAIVGLTLGFLLWHVGFMVIGGEWFGMWESQHWNGVPSAFRFLMTCIAVLIFVAMPDQELDQRET